MKLPIVSTFIFSVNILYRNTLIEVSSLSIKKSTHPSLHLVKRKILTCKKLTSSPFSAIIISQVNPDMNGTGWKEDFGMCDNKTGEDFITCIERISFFQNDSLRDVIMLVSTILSAMSTIVCTMYCIVRCLKTRGYTLTANH